MKKILYFLSAILLSNQLFAQSDDCTTATPITVPVSGNICQNFTSVGGTSDNFTTTCSGNAANNYVWFQYTVTGTQNTITVTPGTIRDLTVVYDATPCADGVITFCNNQVGANTSTIVQANPIGTTVIIGIASSSGTNGTFQLCITSQTPTNPSAGDECTNAIPYCNAANPLSVNNMNIFTGSAVTPSCHLSNPQQDVFITFTATTNGTIAWTADPNNNFTEFDWAIYNVTAGCLGTELCCNYNFANSIGANTGMAPGGAGPCGTTNVGGAAGEFSPTVNAVAGQRYVIRLNNYDGDGTGFVFTWQGTAQIAPTVNFTINPSTVVCASSTTVTINNTSAGIPTWTFGNGNTFTGANPPAQTYNTPGIYPITGTISGACPSTLTRFVQLFGPITAVPVIAPPTCGNSCNGSSVQLTQVDGGDGTFNYNWSSGTTGTSITNQCPGNYTVTVSDGSCPATVLTVTIPSTALITVTETHVDPLCGNNGSINVTASGGTGALSYNWGGGITTEDRTGLGAGVYTVTVTDASSCTSVSNITLTASVLTFAVSVTNTTNVSCNGGSNGSINITAPAGCSSAAVVINEVMYGPSLSNGLDPNTGEYIELIGPPGTNIGCFVLTDGDWTITIPAGTVIPADGIFTIGNNAVYGAGFFDLNAESCACFTEGTGGSALLILTDGGEYVSLFNNTGTFINGLLYGTPTAANTPPSGTGTTAGVINTVGLAGCLSSVTIPAAASFQTHPGGVANNTSLIRSPDGTGAWSSQAGGSPNACNAPTPLTYIWSNGATTEDISGLAANTYTVTVSSGSGCTTTQSVTITQPTAVTASIASSTSVTCNGLLNGSATAAGAGGTGAYTFSWSNGRTTALNTGLAAGTYIVTVSDANLCSNTTTVTISQPTAVTASIASSTSVSCNGGSNGTATAASAGGSGTYTFNWSNGRTTALNTGLAAGTYIVTISDANSCTATASVTISQPSAVTASIPTSSSVTCNGLSNGSATAAGAGGSGTYTFSWSNGPTTALNTGLAAGSYTVTVSDANLCTATSSVIISQPSVVTASISSSTSVSCNGGSNGTATATGAGGSGTYTFIWSNGRTTALNTGLNAGTFTVTVSDANLCSATATVSISQPSAISLTLASTNETCPGANNGSATANASGGNPLYNFAWPGGINGQTALNLPPGTYCVTVTDATFCTATACSNIASSVVTPISAGNDTAYCAGGSAQLNATGGLTYTWSPALGLSATNIANPVASPLVTTAYQVESTIPSGTNLIINGDFSAGNIGFTSNYLFSPGDVTPQSVYDVIPNPQTSHSNFAPCPDHTTGTGNMMVVNGSTIANQNVWCQTVNVVPATDYIFDTYVNTLVAQNPAILQFSVNGVFLGNTFNAPNVTCVWSQFNSVWNSGASTTANICIVNQNTAGGGNDFALDDITFTPICRVRDTVVVTVNPNPVPQITTNSPICSGNTLNLNVNAGSVFNWSGPSFSSNLQNPSIVSAATTNSGTYSVTVSTPQGCSATTSSTVTVNPNPTVNLSPNNALCFGTNSGSIGTVTASGTAPFNFIWSNGQTGSIATALVAGNYSLTLSDVNGCSVTSSTNIAEPTALNANLIATNIDCGGNTNGAADLTVSGGTLPYSFLWSNGATSEDLSGLPGGIFTVTVTDGNGCSLTRTAVTSAPNILGTFTNQVNVSCFGIANGSINLSVNGGVQPYSYNWGGGIFTEDRSGLNAGTYTVTITDANFCTTVTSATISQPSQLLTSVSVTNNSCFGANDGTASVNVSGGTPGYNFLWSNGQNTSVANGLPAGLASITVTDFNGCSASASANITQPSQILANVVQFSNYNGAAITCPGAADGALQVFANGGALPYSFNWSGPQQQTTALATGLAEGTYYVTVTDATGCFAVDTLSIFDPVPLQATVQQVNPFCNADCDGQIIVTATPGTGTLGINGYEYRIFGQGQVGGVFSANNNFLGLCDGTYTVEIRDGNNCILPLSITLTEPAPLTISASFIPVVCNGTATGNATANAGGGVAPYSFTWSNGQTGQTAIGLAAGGYGVTVTDANGCTRATNIVVTQPSVLGASTTFTRPSCFGSTDGSATVTPTGGVAPYSFAWSTGAGAATALGLPAGVFTVTVTDAGGCAIVRSVTVTQPSQLALSVSGTNLTCAGNGTGSATVAIAGGTAPYTILWSNGATTATVSGLGLGIFSVVVTDANGCQQSTQLALTQPNPVVASLVSTTNVSCFGGNNGTATITANGGVPPYRFSWPNGQTTATATGLAAGTYTATVTDNNGCSSSVSMQITQPALLTVVQVTTTAVSCRGGSNGTASAFIQGGSSPYNFSWSNGGSGQSISNLAAGTYFLTVTDGNGCRAFSQAIVTQPASNLVGFINTTPALCLGAATGEMTAIISGGTVPVSGDYTYVWSNGASTAVVSNVAAGNYSVTVTDANGCSISLSTTVGQAGNLNLTVVGSTPATCPGANNGTATVTANGGTGTLSFQWSNGQNTPNATGLAAGVYTVTVTDANGCSQNTSVTVTEGAPINLVTAVTDVRCFGESNGRLDVTSSNISLYFWSTGQVGNPLSNLPAGQYTLTVVDTRGCSTTAVYNVAQPDELLSEITTINPVLCHNGSTANLTATAAGGIAGYSFNWSNGIITAANSNVPSGNYTVTITDANGCRSVSSVSLANPTQLELSVSTVDVRCTGDENGSIIVNGSGGTANLGAYEYSIDSINWQTGDLFPGLGVDSFRVYVRDANGCVTDESAVIEAAEPFFITFFSPQDTTIEYGDTISLSVTLNDNSGASFSWTDVNAGIVIDTTNFTISVSPANEMVYEFNATSPLGCQVDTTVIISVTKPRPAAAPGGFTPNGDGTNDVFFIQGDNRLRSVNVFRVYDRWGECVFIAENVAANDPASGWDGSFKGEKMNSGTYSWYAEVEYIDGFKEIIRGDITLLR